MKLLLTALCASFIALPAFAEDCDKGKCDKEKKEEGTLADCKKCNKDKKEEKKEEGTLAGKCDKEGDCDKEKKEEGTLA